MIRIDPNITVTLNKNCELIFKGCCYWKAFNTAVMKHTILKGGSRITSGETDVCAEMKKNQRGIATSLVSFGMPPGCPVNKNVRSTIVHFHNFQKTLIDE